MKLSEIFPLTEAPFHHNMDAPPSLLDLGSDSSIEGLRREYVELGRLERDNDTFYFWLSAGRSRARITRSVDESENARQQSVGSIEFHDTKLGLPVKNELQVSRVKVSNEFRNHQLAMALYVVLARYGYAVVSDFEQFNGGKFLWKKLAKESDARNFAVRLWSDEQEDWIRDEDGEVVRYNGANVDDAEIWQLVEPYSEATVLLVLTHD